VWSSLGSEGSGFRVQGSGFRVQGLGLRVEGSEGKTLMPSEWSGLKNVVLFGLKDRLEGVVLFG